MNIRKFTSIVFGLVILGLGSVANAGWVAASNGDVPENSLASGQEADGKKLYLCRAKHEGGVHPGKVRKEFGGCNIGYGGKEIAVKDYETYVSGWVKASGGDVPASAMVGGNESNGTKLYICRGEYKGGVHSGKVRSEFGACNLSWGGEEVKVDSYEVLVQ